MPPKQILWLKDNHHLQYLLCLTTLIFFPTNLSSKYHSQEKQDQFINETFFKNKKNGVFIDIGAHDGITFSNTLFFEKDLEWTGICFEPLPNIYKQLQSNRNCICINACVAKEEGTVDFIKVKGYSEMLSGMLKTYEQPHFERLCSEIKQRGGEYKIIQVPSINLNQVLEKYNIKNIDYISIDTEGSELEIIKSIDFSKFNIHIFSIENNYKNTLIRQWMEKHGFQFKTSLSSDEIYYNPNYCKNIQQSS